MDHKKTSFLNELDRMFWKSFSKEMFLTEAGENGEARSTLASAKQVLQRKKLRKQSECECVQFSGIQAKVKAG